MNQKKRVSVVLLSGALLFLFLLPLACQRESTRQDSLDASLSTSETQSTEPAPAVVHQAAPSVKVAPKAAPVVEHRAAPSVTRPPEAAAQVEPAPLAVELSSETASKRLIGGFHYCSGSSFFDQEVEFASDGKFSTYLHHRPFQVGSFSFASRHLMVQQADELPRKFSYQLQGDCFSFAVDTESALYCKIASPCPSDSTGTIDQK